MRKIILKKEMNYDLHVELYTDDSKRMIQLTKKETQVTLDDDKVYALIVCGISYKV